MWRTIRGDPAPVAKDVARARAPDGDFAGAVRAAIPGFRRRDAKGRKPSVAGEEGYQALEIVDAVYRSCRTGEKITL